MRWLDAFERDAAYQRLFPRGVSGAPTRLTRDNRGEARSPRFERAIVSARSPYDRYHFDARRRGDLGSRPSAARCSSTAGRSSCFTCHGGVHFSSAMGSAAARRGRSSSTTPGLYNLAGPLSYPAGNTGLYDVTRDPQGRRQVQGRRRCATSRVTAPYMHDGSVATLEEAIDHYAAGGRTIADGPYRGVGHDNPNKSAVHPAASRSPPASAADLVAFLQSLTDEALLRDPRSPIRGPRCAASVRQT